jgi:hypothetical protein
MSIAAYALFIPPLKGEGRPQARSGCGRGGVTLQFDRAPIRLASLATLPRKRGRDMKAVP